MILIAWSVAGFLGPKIITTIYESTRSYTLFFKIALYLMMFNYIVTIWLKRKSGGY